MFARFRNIFGKHKTEQESTDETAGSDADLAGTKTSTKNSLENSNGSLDQGSNLTSDLDSIEQLEEILESTAEGDFIRDSSGEHTPTENSDKVTEVKTKNNSILNEMLEGVLENMDKVKGVEKERSVLKRDEENIESLVKANNNDLAIEKKESHDVIKVTQAAVEDKKQQSVEELGKKAEFSLQNVEQKVESEVNQDVETAEVVSEVCVERKVSEVAMAVNSNVDIVKDKRSDEKAKFKEEQDKTNDEENPKILAESQPTTATPQRTSTTAAPIEKPKQTINAPSNSMNNSVVVEDPITDTQPSDTAGATAATLPTATPQAGNGNIVIKPNGNNGMACAAIAHKLQEIAEVAESLDAVLRDVQNDGELQEDSNSNGSQQKLLAGDTLRSNSSEDWQSRSTEDDSFATASEGHFTPRSLESSNFQTASERYASSSGKNSFDASELDDDTTLASFDMPNEFISPTNMSFDSSEQSFYSVHDGVAHSGAIAKRPRKKSSPSTAANNTSSNCIADDENSSIVDIDELHSESVTPTPDNQLQDYCQQQHGQPPSIPIIAESDGYNYNAGIADAPSIEILTEMTAPTQHSTTPEVSNVACANTSNNSSNDNVLSPQNNATNQKPNVAWRRSKYYENITKQTIKGFL